MARDADNLEGITAALEIDISSGMGKQPCGGKGVTFRSTTKVRVNWAVDDWKMVTA